MAERPPRAPHRCFECDLPDPYNGVYTPEHRHSCGPNRFGYWLDHHHDMPGTVRECRVCGRSWVAWRDRSDPGYMGVKWRREGWWARWRRHRRSVANGDQTIRIPGADTDGGTR